MDDAKIVDLYFARDEDAIAQTSKKYGARLRHLANRILQDDATAEECENDTYLNAWERIPPHEPREYLFVFLGKITRHLAIDICRKNQAQKRQAYFCELTQEMEECISGDTSAESGVEEDALAQAINIFLADCKEEQRNVFVRRYWYFDSIDEIAERYGFSKSKVKTMLFRQREKLGAHLEKEGYVL